MCKQDERAEKYSITNWLYHINAAVNTEKSRNSPENVVNSWILWHTSSPLKIRKGPITYILYYNILHTLKNLSALSLKVDATKTDKFKCLVSIKHLKCVYEH